MSTAAARTGNMRGGLVGVCSATISAAAHTVAGGALPSGAALVLVILVCAVVGAAAGRVSADRRGVHTGFLVAALLAGQFLGHLAFAVTASHHHGRPHMSPSMAAAHAVGALVCAVLIGLAEHLYVVATTVLSWLAVYAINRCRPVVRDIRSWANPPVLQPLILNSGGGTRGPPRGAALVA